MWTLIGTIVVVFIAGTISSQSNNSIVHCNIYGDPYLTPFVLNKQGYPMTTACDLAESPVVFFRNKYVEIQVVNQGTMYGYIISFSVILFEEESSDDDVCSFNEHNFKSSLREFRCGSVAISIGRVMKINYPNGDLRIEIENRSTHYKLDLWTSLINANKSRGLCVKGCPVPKTNFARSLLPRTLSEDQMTSAMAEQICDIYLQEFTGTKSLVPIKMKEFVQATHRACVTDVTVMGNKKYAEEAVENIVSTWMTLNATSLEQIQTRMQQASTMIERINKIAGQLTSQIINNYKAQNLNNK